MSVLKVARGHGEVKRANLIGAKGFMKDVAGGQACFTYNIYPDGCSGSPLPDYSIAWTVGDSIESGCDNYDGGSSSAYCDSEGYHLVYFNKEDCLGDAKNPFDILNGCHEEDGYSWGINCSFDGPCSAHVMESAV
eukprot:CAMPEP_0172511270 /NCGR_PEP_ID=MMETSP1066-20121228/235139_1 /TAXON_ID=671091 /ORGANISM="Coscinodiscus wailesii, Strain CCMP2513" /LENGTH=134 /DNA_ID=CAMNT_0013290579 /DNA_START=70 /DNA_END=474 /DNA_ORIENTATION=-